MNPFHLPCLLLLAALCVAVRLQDICARVLTPQVHRHNFRLKQLQLSPTYQNTHPKDGYYYFIPAANVLAWRQQSSSIRRNLSQRTEIDSHAQSCERFRIGVVKSSCNLRLTKELSKGVLDGLESNNVLKKNVITVEVAGLFDLPLASKWLGLSEKVDAIVAIGCAIEGGTITFTSIADTVSQALMKVQLETLVPVICGVLTCTSLDEADSRVKDANICGISWGQNAIQMAALRLAARGEFPGRNNIGFYSPPSESNSST